MGYMRGCIVCGWTTFKSEGPPTEPGGPPCPECGHRIGAGPEDPASPEEIEKAQAALERFARAGFHARDEVPKDLIFQSALASEEGWRKLGEACWDIIDEGRRRALGERFSRLPNIIPEQERNMSMEKRAVVETEAEKTAQKQIAKKFVEDDKKAAAEKKSDKEEK